MLDCVVMTKFPGPRTSQGFIKATDAGNKMPLIMQLCPLTFQKKQKRECVCGGGIALIKYGLVL